MNSNLNRLSQSVFRTKTSSDNKVCKERNIEYAFNFGSISSWLKEAFERKRKKYCKDGKASPVWWFSHRPWRVSICISS